MNKELCPHQQTSSPITKLNLSQAIKITTNRNLILIAMHNKIKHTNNKTATIFNNQKMINTKYFLFNLQPKKNIKHRQKWFQKFFKLFLISEFNMLNIERNYVKPIKINN